MRRLPVKRAAAINYLKTLEWRRLGLTLGQCIPTLIIESYRHKRWQGMVPSTPLWLRASGRFCDAVLGTLQLRYAPTWYAVFVRGLDCHQVERLCWAEAVH